MEYDILLLKSIIQRDSCQVDLSTVGFVNRDTKITYICKCGEQHTKGHRAMYQTGAICKKCATIQKTERMVATNIKNTGVANPSQLAEVKEKKKETCFKNNGVEYPTQSKEIQERIVATNMKTLGVARPLQSEVIKEKSRQTDIDKYGHPNHSQCEKVKEKIRETNIIRFGHACSMQNAEVAAKNAKSRSDTKEFTFPSGYTIYVQGYEPIALEYLVENGYTETDLETSRKEVPEIWYTDKNMKRHRYFCDIFIPEENKIIEVKSTWTYDKYKEINELKASACRNLGYTFEFWIVSIKNGQEYIEII
jgi:hypothetical protein